MAILTTIIMGSITIMTDGLFDDFFVRALVAGIGVALITGPIGCQIIWQRLAYFGETVAHSALLGVAIALLMQVHLSIGAFAAAATVALTLLWFGRQRGLPSDALLGILAHGSLATGLVLVSLIDGARVDLVNVLFGDILAISDFDIALIFGVALLVLVILFLIWRPLLAATVHVEIAAAEGLKTEWIRLCFLLMVAAVVAIAVKIIGVLLLTAMLIIPAATARHFARSPEGMAFIASMLGVCAVITGLLFSLRFDSPSGPSIVVVATLMFVFSQALASRWRRHQDRKNALNHESQGAAHG